MTRFRLAALVALLALASTTHCEREATTGLDPTAAASVRITPASPPSLAIGHSVALTAMVRRGDGSVLTYNVDWSSAQPAIATVALDSATGAGVVTAWSAGTAVIFATNQTARDSVIVTVHSPGPVVRVSLAPGSLTIAQGTTYALQVASRDSDLVTVTPQAVTFRSSDPGVAQVDSSGLVTGVGPGAATLTVTCDGVTATASVRVVPPPRAVFWTSAGAITDLGTLPGFGASGAEAINAGGTIVGSVTTLAGNMMQHAFIWTAAGGMRDLGTLVPGGNSAATGINRGGQVVGWASLGLVVHAVLWNPDGTIRDLGAATAGGTSEATGINDLGEVVGWSVDAQGKNEVPFRWSDAGGLTVLPLSGGAAAVNNAGLIVGSTSDQQPFVWSAASGMRLLVGSPAAPHGAASSINDAGDIVGWSGDLVCDYYYPCSGLQRATLWSGTLVVNVATNGNAEGATALGINNNGQVVGMLGQAFLWSSTSGVKSLSALPGHSGTVAVAINDAGQIVGTSLP